MVNLFSFLLLRVKFAHYSDFIGLKYGGKIGINISQSTYPYFWLNTVALLCCILIVLFFAVGSTCNDFFQLFFLNDPKRGKKIVP